MAAMRAQAPDASIAWKLESQATRLVLGLQTGETNAGTAAQLQKDAHGGSQLWHFMPAGYNRYKIVNLATGGLLGVAQTSNAVGAAAVECADTGAADRIWQPADGGGGSITLTNVNNNLLLGTASSGAAVLMADDGSARVRWKLIPAGPAYPDPIAVTGDTRVHDPSLIRTLEGTYYLFGTHRAITVSSSPDRIHFTRAGEAFKAIPAWVTTYTPNRDLWAPDVSRHDGKYWLYYACSRSGTQLSAIGVAISTDAAPGSWDDQGPVIKSQAGSAYNAIDPGLVTDSAGGWWLSFGSFWNGINLIQIDPLTGKPSGENNPRYELARRPVSPAVEAAYIYRHVGSYYLFVSFDQCCRGINSTYHIVVGRSANVTGPYRDECGVDMSQGGGTILLGSHGRYIGPGGQMVLRDGDADYLVYHYYDGNANGAPALGINRLTWDARGWPHVCGENVSCR